GTISSVGRYVKKYGISTEIVLADTQFSIYYDYVMYGRFKNESGASLWVEPGMAGIGYGPMGMARRGETTSIDTTGLHVTRNIEQQKAIEITSSRVD
ncbi:hypothetical protein COOONC_18376, partial [Cooperia oncophora]